MAVPLIRNLMAFVLLIVANEMVAQPYCSVRTFNIRDGLPSNNVSSIMQGRDGMIWTSTWNGLCYYDGYDFVPFRSSSDGGWLSSNRILLIKNNVRDDIWVITYDRRLYLFDTKKTAFVNVGEAVREKIGSDFRPRNIYPVAGGHTWVTGHQNHVAVRLSDYDPTNPDSMVVVHPRNADGSGHVRKVENDACGREWLFYDDHVELSGTDVRMDGLFEHLTNVGDVTFLASSDGRLCSFLPGRGALVEIGLRRGITSINSLVTYDDCSVLIGTNDGIEVYDCRRGKTRTITTGRPSTPMADVTDIFVDSRKRIWAFTSAEGITVSDMSQGEARHVYESAETKASTGSRSPLWLEDQFGTVWLVPRGGVFGYYDDHSGCIRPYPLQSPHFGFADVPEIERFYVDDRNNLWLSSFHDLTLVSFRHPVVKRIPLIKNQETRSLLVRSDGCIWAGTSGGVIGVFDGDGRLMHYLGRSADGGLRYSDSPIRFSDKIYAMYEDKGGRVWIGTKGYGLYVIMPDGSVSHCMPDQSDDHSINCDIVYDFSEDNRGNLWVATYGGGLNLAKIGDGGKVRFVNRSNELRTYPTDDFGNVRRVTQDGNGNVFLSCTDGLLVFSNRFKDPSQIAFYQTTHRSDEVGALRTGNVMQALVTRSGEILVSTMGGDLQRVDTEALLQPQLNFTDIDGGVDGLEFSSISDGNILSMIEDNNGNICITRDASMMVYLPSKGLQFSLGSSELGENFEFTEALPVVSPKDGRIWLGAVGGLISFSAEEMYRSDYSPNIVFTQVKYQGEAKTSSILHSEMLHVPAGKRDISVMFAALDYASDKEIQYAYKLDGVDDDWTYAGTSNVARLSSLKPGLQRLLVKSTNSDGVWSDDIHRLDILVDPTFWETPVAKLIYLLIAVAILAIGFHIYELRRKNAMHQELDRMKTKFFADMSHKLRTPLTLISGPVAEVLGEQSLSDNGRRHLQMVQNNSARMLALVNKMLRWSQDNGVYISDDNAVEVASLAQVESYPEGEMDEPEIQTVPNSKSIKLLVVEDNEELRNFLRDILSPNYSVIVAENGKAGLDKAEHDQPDFIITDVTMPEMDGLTMVNLVKQNKALSHIPIIVLSAKASLNDRMIGLRMGIDDYVTKPFSASYLKQRIANIILQRRMLQQTYLELLGRTLPLVSTDVTVGPELQTLPEAEASESSSLMDKTTEMDTPNGDDGNVAVAKDHRDEYKLESPRIADADQEMMTRLLKFLETRIDDENLKIEELAEAVNLGRTVFYGKIKSLVGVSPSDFLRHIRMQRAAELIAKSKMNFSQIAFNVGFSDPKYFTKCFKKETGMTPSEYRAKARAKASDHQD